MKGWILYKPTEVDLKPETYEINRFVEEGKKMGIELDVISPDQIDLMVTHEKRKSILVDGQITPLPDFVLPRMGAGTTYFALAVIRHLERLGIPCFNSSESTEIVKDKLFSQQILAEKNLPVPKTMLVKFPVNEDLVEDFLGFPVVIKTLSGSQGKGVFLSDNKKSFVDLMHLIEGTNSALNVILQEFIKDSYGKDLRVFTIGGKAIASMERKAAEGGFKANFSDGASVIPYVVSPEIAKLATEAARISGLDIAGVDLLFDGDHFKICEVNSSPGFEGLESCCNINIPQEILNYIINKMGHMHEGKKMLL